MSALVDLYTWQSNVRQFATASKISNIHPEDLLGNIMTARVATGFSQRQTKGSYCAGVAGPGRFYQQREHRDVKEIASMNLWMHETVREFKLLVTY